MTCDPEERLDEAETVIPSIIIGSDRITRKNKTIKSQADYDLAYADMIRYSEGAFRLSEILRKTVKRKLFTIVKDTYHISGVSNYSKAELISLIKKKVLGVTALHEFIKEMSKAERQVFETLAGNGSISIVYKGNDEAAHALDSLIAKRVIYNIPGTNNYCIPFDIAESYGKIKEIGNKRQL